jgi:hypothetical protein
MKGAGRLKMDSRAGRPFFSLKDIIYCVTIKRESQKNDLTGAHLR